MTMHDQRFDRALPTCSSSSPAPPPPTISRPPSSAPRPDLSVPRGRTPEGGFPWISRPRRLRSPGCRGVNSASSPSSASSSPWPPSRTSAPDGVPPRPAVRPGRERRHRDGTRRRHRDRGSRDGRRHPDHHRPRGRRCAGLFPRWHADRLRAARRGTRRSADDHGRQCRWFRPLAGDSRTARQPPVVDPLAGRPRPARGDE